MKPHPGGGYTVRAADGFDLWLDSWGQGPGIVFLARVPTENRRYAEALADAYRVVLFEPREMALHAKGALESLADPRARETVERHLAGRNLSWDPAAYSEYPLDLMVGDLHRAADAAGLDRFVLAGYSGTASLAAFLASASPRVVGVVLGGAHVLGWQQFWLGYLGGYSAAATANPELSDLTKSLLQLMVLQAELELDRDTGTRLGALPGPRILWGGSRDGESDDPGVGKALPGLRIGFRVQRAIADYHRLGFEVFQLEGLGHLAAFNAVDRAVPLIRGALVRAGYR